MGGGKCVVRSVVSVVCGVLVGGCVGNSLSVVCSVNTVVCVVCIVVGVDVVVCWFCMLFVRFVVCICCSVVFNIVCCIVCLFVVVWRLVSSFIVWLFVCMVLFVGLEFVLLFCISFSLCSRCSLLLFLFSSEIYFG